MTRSIAPRKLGPDGPDVCPLGFGCAVLSPGYYEPVDEATAIDTLRHAIDRGVNLIDTSNVYGVGHNESLVGRAIAGRREKVVLASKFGWVIDDSPGAAVHVNYRMPGIRANGRPEYIRRQIDASLQRLGVDHLDLYYQHFPDPDTPVEETVGAMAELVRAGKILHVGLCNTDADRVRRAHAIHPIAAVENEYSLWTRTPEHELLETTRELGIAFVPWSPLGSGFLAADIPAVPATDFRIVQPRFEPENLARNAQRFAPLRRLAGELGLTPAQLALAWLLHRGGHVIPIPGMTARWQVDQNLAAAEIALDAHTMARIDELAPPGLAAGGELI